MSLSSWEILPSLPEAELSRISGEDLTPLVAQLLYNRGITSPTQIEHFLTADKRLLHDPFLLPDMEKAVARVYRALLSGEAIAIYGDFDADGITATALLVEGLSALGGYVIPYIPHRADEGYGINNAALERLAKQGINLVVTVDCGITAIEEVEVAKQLGIDIVITDHHTVPAQIPSALAVIDPKRADSRYPFPDLAGVGVAYKLLQALYRSIGREGDIEAYLDLVALGTVADMVSLLGENRYLVKKGLEVLRNTIRPGLEEIARCAGVTISSVDSETISWVLAPRINAAGRLDHAGVGYHLLTTSSSDEARRLAGLLERKNTDRKSLTEEMLLKAREQINATDTDSPFLMVGGEDFHSGVVGIVAGRLVDEFFRPVIVFERGSEWSRGSARSIPNFDVVAAMSDCSDLLSRFGGHPMAAGFTIATENLELFKARLVEIASRQISSFEIRHLISIDADVPVSSLGGNTYQMIQQLAPFGNGNPYPVFIARDIKVGEYRRVGSRGDHLKLRLIDNGTSWNGIGFKMGHLTAELAPRMDIVFNLEVDQWGGREALQLKILDFAPAT